MRRPRRARAGRRGRRRAHRPAAARASRPPCARARATPRARSSTWSGGTAATPSASSTRMSPGSISRPPTVTASSIAPTDVLGRPADRDEARPDRQAQLRQLLDISHRAVDEHRGRAVRLRLSREQVADQRDRFRLGHRHHEDVAGLERRHRGVHHQVVALAAAHGARRARGARARDDLVPRHVDQPAAAGRLVDRGGAEPGELGELRSQRRDHLRQDALEGLGVAHARIAGRAARMVAALLGALRVVASAGRPATPSRPSPPASPRSPR